VCFQVVPTKWYGTLSATQNLHSWVTASGRRRHRQVGKEKNGQVPKPNRSPQRSIRRTQINPRLSLGSQGGSKSTPRARITMKPKLARSCWFDTTTGKSLRNRNRERQGEQHREVCFWLVLRRDFPPAGASSRAPEVHSCTLGKHLLVWCSSHTDLGPGVISLHVVTCR
jgi:hypothetical protein